MTGRMGNLMNAQEMHKERHWERMARVKTTEVTEET